MTIWFVHRRADNSIASAHIERQPGYAEEALDDASNTEIIAYRQATRTSPDLSDIDNLDKTVRALGLVIANFTGKTPAQVKQAFMTAYKSLP